MVASDRISTYDVVHPTPIPDKGKVLTGLSVFWFELTRRHRPQPPRLARPTASRTRSAAAGCASSGSRCCPVECVVRGYLGGLGLEGLPGHGRGLRASSCRPGLRESEQLPEPIFTPSTKAEEGHDEAIDFDRAGRAASATAELAERLRDVVDRASTRASPSTPATRGMILADTKFEFGLDADGVLTLGDEVLTPDSSRFWPADGYEPGRAQPRFDKQYVRDWASGTGWDKTPPAPAIPDDVVARTRERYVRPTSASPASPSPPGWSGPRLEPARGC